MDLMNKDVINGMEFRANTAASVSAMGHYRKDGIGYTETPIHLRVSIDGDIHFEAIQEAAINTEMVAELEPQERRALRDALDESLE